MGIAEQVEKRQEQDDTFWATKEAEDLNRELLKVYDENRENENGAETFIRIAEERLGGRAASAPNQNAAKKLRMAIGDNITSIYSRALTNSSEIRELNKLSETKVSAQKIGEMVNSSDPLSKDLVMMTSQTMIGQRLAAINSLNYSDASKRKLRGAFLEELAISVSPNVPEFAKQLIDTTDIDEARKVTLRNQFDSYASASNAAAIYNYEYGKTGKFNEIESIYSSGVPIAPPPKNELDAIYGPEKSPLKQAQFNELYRVANTVVGEFNKVRELPFERQAAYIASKLDTSDPKVSEGLTKRIKEAKEQQEKYIGTWMVQNNKAVQDAFAVAYSAPENQRYAKLKIQILQNTTIFQIAFIR
jgi:hypothetical protein